MASFSHTVLLLLLCVILPISASRLARSKYITIHPNEARQHVEGARSGNMNGKYVVASGGANGVPYNDDYASKGYEYFDVWAPEIATHYGEVFWTDQGKNPLPDHIVKRFAGKTMAITGYEMDQVMVQPVSQPGVHPDLDVSVPINWAYNHHYMMWMTGAFSRMETLAHFDPLDVRDHGGPLKRQAVDLPAAALRADPSIPTSQMFSEGNGGESRKSYHGYPSGYAQLIDSPNEWHLTPMQIDTRNRDCGATPASLHNCTDRYHPGPEPKQARYGRAYGAYTNYSGILECPCTSRYGGDPAFYPAARTKLVEHDFTAQVAPSCAAGQLVTAPRPCFDAVAALGLNATTIANRTVSDPRLPPGCSASTFANGTGCATFNEDSSAGGRCSTSPARSGQAALSPLGVTFGLQLIPPERSGEGSEGGSVRITMSGPADVWFGIGIDAKVMADQPYTIVVNETAVMERKIGTCGSEAEHCPGDLLPASLTLQSSTVASGRRTVVLTRAMQGASKRHYTFLNTTASLNIIAAVGSSPAFAYHKAHATGMVTLTGADAGTCVCDAGIDAQICDTGGTGCRSFVKRCAAAPAGSLLEQRNPTCNSRQYSGGLNCCRHKQIMLDADQEVRPELLRYHLKFRFWFQEYTPANTTASPPLKPSHYDLPRIYYQTESWAGEYDVPPAFRAGELPIVGYDGWPAGKPTPGTTCTGACPDGPDCECEHTIHFKWSMSNQRLIYAGGHCHAPSCISIELYRNDTGHEMELLCRQTPVVGQGRVAHDKFDEAGYIAIPPCLWGDDPGLLPSVLLPENTPMVSIKKNRNTHQGHFGEMASWQMRGTPF